MRRKFSKEEKLAAIQSLERGEAVEINPKMVRRWRDEWHQYGVRAFSGYGNPRTPTLKKTQPVIFRVTHEEYDRLSACVSSSKARSLSEFARGRLFDAEPSPREIEQKVNRLTAAVVHLTRMIAKA